MLGISEIVLVVRDVERAARFYQDALGLVPETEVSEAWAWFRFGDPNRPQRLALRNGPLLFEEHSPNPPGHRWGQVHFALHVSRNELEARLEKARRVTSDIYGPVRLEWMQADSYYFYDLDGNLLEFWSPDPE